MHKLGRPIALLVVLVLPLAARAQQDIEKQVSRMNKKAMEDYDALEFDSARKTLIDAVSILRANGYDETPVAAKTYVNLAILYIAGFKDRNRGIQQLVNALKIKPDIKLDPALATPELEDAFQAAQKQAGVGKRPAAPPPPQKPVPVEPPPSDVQGLQHQPVDESRPESPIPVRALLGGDLGATKVYLLYRGDGQEDFVAVPMKSTGGGEWSAVIPGDVVVGRAIQYYLEARDARGRAVAASASAQSPHLIAITETAAPPQDVPEVDVEDPLAAERARRRREAEERRGRGRRQHYGFVFVMPGFGFGYQPAGNTTEVAFQYQATTDTYERQTVGSGGVAVAPLHLAVEAGGFIPTCKVKPCGSGLLISALGRFQVFTAANAETVTGGSDVQAPTRKATGAVAVMLRLRYKFLEGIFHPYLGISIGGGQLRHTLDVSSAGTDEHPLVDRFTAETYNMGGKDAKNPGRIDPALGSNQPVCRNPRDCLDTIALGYLLVGGGAGVWIDIWKYFAFVADLNLLGAIGVGGGQTGMNLDIQVGIGAHF